MSRFTVKFPRQEFYPEIFDQLVTERGVTVTWEQATMCPCVRADAAGRTTFSCGDCVNGNVYFASEDITAVVSNITGQRNAAVYGELAVGGLHVVTYGKHRLGINDRIILQASTTRYAELCSLGAAVVRQAATAGETTLTLDHTRKFPVSTDGETVMYARVGPAETGAVISYTGKTATTLTGIPTSGSFALPATVSAQTGVQAMSYQARYAPIPVLDLRTDAETYTPTTDYTVVGKWVHFQQASKVPTDRFTMAYEARPAYIVDSMGHEYRDQMLTFGFTEATFARFPIAVIARKDFLNPGGR